MKQKIFSHLPGNFPWQVHWFNTIDSTNNEAKRMAQAGAPHGTVLIAGQQTGGRGRMGRSFSSAPGGIYLSVILRPACSPVQLMHLTCAVGVAMCDAVEQVTGFRPGIKWINDLVAGSKKLGGILTELSIDANSQRINYAVVGIGLNCNQLPGDFPAELDQIAVSLNTVLGKAVPEERIAAAMLCSLQQMDSILLTHKASVMQRYRKDCVTLGQQIHVVGDPDGCYATAFDVDDDGALMVRFADGAVKTLQSGEVSVRGMYGYV